MLAPLYENIFVSASVHSLIFLLFDLWDVSCWNVIHMGTRASYLHYGYDCCIVSRDLHFLIGGLCTYAVHTYTVYLVLLCHTRCLQCSRITNLGFHYGTLFKTSHRRRVHCYSYNDCDSVLANECVGRAPIQCCGLTKGHDLWPRSKDPRPRASFTRAKIKSCVSKELQPRAATKGRSRKAAFPMNCD